MSLLLSIKHRLTSGKEGSSKHWNFSGRYLRRKVSSFIPIVIKQKEKKRQFVTFPCSAISVQPDFIIPSQLTYHFLRSQESHSLPRIYIFFKEKKHLCIILPEQHVLVWLLLLKLIVLICFQKKVWRELLGNYSGS